MSIRCIVLATSAAGSRLLLIAALFAGLLGLMPTRPVYAASIVYVNNPSDTDHGSCAFTCTLRDAINAANKRNTSTTIRFKINGTITLSAPLPTIDSDMTIDGTGHAITVSGGSSPQMMAVNPGRTFGLQSIVIANYYIPYCPASCNRIIYNAGTMTVISSTFSNNFMPYPYGYIIDNRGTLSVIGSTFSNNYFDGSGAVLFSYNGDTLSVTNSTFSDNGAGGIINYGTASVINSTISNNRSYSYGGGIDNGGTGTVTIINSTFSGNETWSYGGGLENGLYGTAIIINSTFLGNRAYYRVEGGGGGSNNRGSLTMINSIFANNYSGDCVSYAPATGNNNLIKDLAYTCGLTNGVNGNLIGVDPQLSLLGDHGGRTLTFLPLPGSPAINAGDNAACPAFDQRGVKRTQEGTCDIGAVEALPWQRFLLPQVMR